MRRLAVLILCILLLAGCGSQAEKDAENEYIPTNADFLAALKDLSRDTDLAIYRMSEKYAEDFEVALNSVPSDMNEWQDLRIVTVRGFGEDKVADSLNYLKDFNRWPDLKLENTGIMEAFEKIRKGEADVLIMSQGVIEKLKDNEQLGSYVSFLENTGKFSEVSQTMDFSLIRNSFNILIAGSDSREAALDETSRYDVDIVMSVDPVNKQMLIISIPRDSFVPNPAYDYGEDKLTHLGSNGPSCSMEGLSLKFDTEIKLYAMTNFVEFINFIDMLGGLDFYNPYSFYLNNGGKGYFEEGNIHVNGKEALSYSRERFNLPNGDIDRNEHNMILLNAIIGKVFSWENLNKFDEMYAQFRKCFLTNVSEEQIAAFALMQYSDKPDWNIISYHIRGDYENVICSSHVSSGPLTVCKLYEDDLEFVKAEINKVLNGETISQGSLPSDSYY